MCAWLSVSRSGFYTWRARPRSATAERRENLKEMITDIFTASDATYGYRRVHAALARRGVTAGPELVRALMRERDLHPCQPRPYRMSTTQAADAGTLPDLLRRDFTAQAPGTKTVGDITYIPTKKAGCIWRPSSTATRRKSSDTPWRNICAPNSSATPWRPLPETIA